MPVVKKIKWDWYPSENKNLKIDELIFIGDATRLIQDGTVEYMSEDMDSLKFKPKVEEPKPVVPAQPEFYCVACQKKFKNKRALSSHNRILHPKPVV